MLQIFLEGFFLQASLILALGAQNLFVLDSGLRKNRHLFVAAICSLCDFLLIMLGVLGASTIFLKIPVLKILFGLLGIAFLAFYALKKLREAFQFSQYAVAIHAPVKNLKQILFLSLGFSLLNPHVYLDTVILIGGYSSKYLPLTERLNFGLGASSFSLLWFFGLAILASLFNQLLKNKVAMKVISFLSGAVLLYLSINLGLEVYSWL